MSSSKVSLKGWNEFISIIKQDFADIKFIESDSNSFNSEQKIIHYKQKSTLDKSVSSLLHELGHLTSKHKQYHSDMKLVIMEAEAWDKAKILASKYGFSIDEDYIQDCLDSYRDWLHRRSTCPKCGQNGLQTTDQTLIYRCINCGQVWKVSNSRFCRTYRRTKDSQKPIDF